MSETPVIHDEERLDLPSGSQMEIVVECPGSVNLKHTISPGMVHDTRSADEKEWGKRGDRIHKAFQTGQTVDLNSEELETYNIGIKHEQRIVQKWVETKALDPALVKEGPRELRVWLHKPYDFLQLMGSAKLDRHYIYRDPDRCCLLVLDLKSGWNPNLPPSAHSWQLKYQLIALWREEYDGVTDGRVAYVKPKEKCDLEDYCDYQIQDLRYSFDSIAFHSWQATQPDAPRRPGLHCNWCQCKAWCPEALAYALLPSTIAKVFNPKHIAERVNSVSGDDLYRIWESGPVIKKILDAVINRLKTFSTDDLFVLNLERGKGRENSPITAVKECFLWLRDALGWDEDRVWGCLKFINEKLAEVAQLRDGLTEKEAKEWVKTNLEQFITVNLSDQPLRKRK